MNDIEAKGPERKRCYRGQDENGNAKYVGDLSAKGFAHHYRLHIPHEWSINRVIMDQRASEITRQVGEEAEAVVDQITMARLGVQQFTTRLMKGDVTIDAKEAIAMGRMLMDYDELMGDRVDESVWQDALFAFLDIAKEMFTPEQYLLFQQQVRTNPILQKMTSRSQDDVIEAQAQLVEENPL
jgi:hypothetical protein